MVKNINGLREKLSKEEMEHHNSVRTLRKELAETISNKDALYTETVNNMKTDFRDELSATKSMLIE